MVSAQATNTSTPSRNTSTNTSTNTGATSTNNQNKVLDKNCLQAKIIERNNKIQTALDQYLDAIKSAFSAKKEALSTIWTNSTKTEKEIRVDIKTIYSNFLKAKKDAKMNYVSTTKAAWKEFKETAKTQCNAINTGETSSYDLNF
jgi:uncharacterized Zn finger protein